MTERKHEKLEETVVSKNQIACVITRERETVVPVKVELKLPTGIKTIPLVVLANSLFGFTNGKRWQFSIVKANL